MEVWEIANALGVGRKDLPSADMPAFPAVDLSKVDMTGNSLIALGPPAKLG